jgi:hypothetical protein
MQNTIPFASRQPRRRKHIVATTCIDHPAARRDLYHRYLARLRHRIRGSRWFLAQMRSQPR